MSLWLAFAIMAPLALGVANVIDEAPVAQHTPSVHFYAFRLGALKVVVGGSLLLTLSLDGANVGAIASGLLPGIIRGASLFVLLLAFKHGQLSRITPAYYIHPIMVAPFSVLFLGEQPGGLVWGAIVLAMLGTGLVSWQGRGEAGAFSQPLACAGDDGSPMARRRG